MNLRELTIWGTTVRVATWSGAAGVTPLLMFNGIGSSIELLEPFAAALDGVPVICFDVPGTGGSEAPSLPYPMWMLACFAGRVLDELGHERIDVLGVSWGGAVAQQFALQNPRRCRRLVLCATSPGMLMVPPKPSVLRRMATPRRHNDARYRRAIAGELYGGKARHDPHILAGFRHASPRGYLYQQLALATWTSLPFLPLLTQPTLVMTGADDPVVPPVNAQLLAHGIRDSRVHVVPGDGHLFLISSAAESAAVVREFLLAPDRKVPA